MIRNEKEFYTILLKEIEKRIGDKKTDFSSLKQISRPTYYNIKEIIKGEDKAPRLSITKIKKVCKELEIPFEKVHFEINDKYKEPK